ncbi:MAG: hypothetical protein EPO26_16970 [Chloroflexota bacterium]|nr:MAG: hypothetical protein EPO26_16970 [Chloroflexota bacterium]
MLVRGHHIWLSALLAASLLATLLPTAAFAHERRSIGPYQVVVGFITEPALLGEPNGVDFRVTNAANGEPIEGVEKTVKVAIASGGGQPREFALRARFGMKGAYTADLIPTRAGAYVFRFTGEINGTKVDEKFESGPGRFNDVVAADTLQFPEVVPSAVELRDQLAAARARADQAWLIATIGGAVGVLGAIVGAFALLRRPGARSI